MLQIANDGLNKLGVELIERDKFLNIIKRRLSIGITGSTWTQETLKYLRKSMNNEKACATLLDMYFINQMEGHPISEWECCWE